jgi:hypothetical protein
MYEVVSIDQYAATRSVELRNMRTNVIDVCFDDSAVVSLENFDFLQVGQTYDCKIKLFGKCMDEVDEDCVICVIRNPKVTVGNKVMIEVAVDSNVYYVNPKNMKNRETGRSFLFRCTRKDLIQVNDTLHADYL